MKEVPKRKQRAYKMYEVPYRKAMKRASKENSSLAYLIENWVTQYANGHKVSIILSADQIIALSKLPKQTNS